MIGRCTRLPLWLSGWLAGRRRPVLFLALLGVVLASPSLWTEPVADDLLHELILRPTPGITGLRPQTVDLFRFASGDIEQTRALMSEGVFPWWTDPNVRLSFMRPLAGLTHFIDQRWFSGHAGWMHLQSLLWFAALLVALGAVYLRFAPRRTALFALLLYAIDDAHAPTVAWLANRSAIIGLLGAMLALLTHDIWRQGGDRRFRFISPALFAVGLSSGETAVAGAAYFVAYAAFLERGSLRQRVLSLTGPGVVMIAWRVSYVLLDYGTSGSGVYLDPLADPLAFAAAAAARLPVLLLASVALPWADWWELYPLLLPGASAVVWCIALALLAGLALLLRPAWRTSASARFWSLGALLAAVPAASTFPHDRMLLGVTVGSMGALAELLLSVRPVEAAWKRLALAGLILVHLVLAPVLLPLRSATVDELSRLLRRTMVNFPPSPSIEGTTIALLNPPLDPFAAYLPIYREAERLPRPNRFVWLASGTSAVRILRLDSHTLSVRPELGYLHHSTQLMLRSPQRRFQLGDRVQLPVASFEIAALTRDGRPAEVTVRFAQSLDDPRLQLFRWDDRSASYVRLTPPRTGQGATLPGSQLLGLLFG